MTCHSPLRRVEIVLQHQYDGDVASLGEHLAKFEIYETYKLAE